MEDAVEKVKRENKIFYLLGAYNTNLVDFDKHTLTLDFVDLSHSHSFVSPTRSTKMTTTLIDNVLTNSFPQIG